MAVLKCKMCGGDLHFEEGTTICECEYCGNTNTLPVVSSDQEMNLFNRANHFRMINEFDKAISAYERILEADDTNAEAHWGIVLSRYGIEYVEDPVSHERIPTCHRVQLTSILSDPDYLAAVEHADFIASAEYKAQAERIAQIQKEILAISSQEKPYDVFICYKESDDNGNRTIDSTLAQDIYYGLTESKYRVFFSRITLEDKLGQEYEPYIFAALNSAKVMVVVGTKPEYFNAVWVKNEWSRYLDLMKNDRKRLLIPCYRDMDPYDLPDELSMLQSQDMGKIGFMQDLLRGIRKVLAKDTGKPVAQETVVVQQTASGTTANAQVKRGYIALEDHDWIKADGFFEEALNLDPECAEAYLGKLLVQKRQESWISLVNALKNQNADIASEKLEACPEERGHIERMVKKYSLKDYVSKDEIRKLYDYDRSYISTLSFRKTQREELERQLSADRLLCRAKQYAGGETKRQIEEGLTDLTSVLDQRVETCREEDNLNIERIKAEYASHIAAADIQAEELFLEADRRREQYYQQNVALLESAKDLTDFEKARNALNQLNGYKDSVELAGKCLTEINSIKENQRQEKERQEEYRRKEAERAKKKRKTIIAVFVGIVVGCISFAVVYVKVIIPNNKYNAVVAKMESGNIDEAYEELGELDGYRDSDELRSAILYHFKNTIFDTRKVGQIIKFGSYEQDNDPSDGAEEIEWIILANEEDRVLLISKYVLDCQQFNTEINRENPWSDSSIRKWLNETFIKNAFNTIEIDAIDTSNISAEKNPDYDTNPGSDTQDKVFLLSISEAEDYFSSDEDRKLIPTAYAENLGESLYHWWLRSPGEYEDGVAFVNEDGSIDAAGFDYQNDWYAGVRPALWVKVPQRKG